MNASLNFTSAVFLGAGYAAQRSKRIAIHRFCMITAFAVSVVFLVCYLVYHAKVGSVPFPGQGWVRPVYFSILISHILLAATTPVFATVTLIRGLRYDIARHRAVARWAWPIWMYVSVTGVIVYLMLYRYNWS